MNKKLIVCILSLVISICVARAETTKVIGEAKIKKGTAVAMLTPSGPAMGMAFEDQRLYIIEKIAPKPGKHNGGYILLGDGFIHDCPYHGREVVDQAIISIATEQVENDPGIEIKIYQE